MFEWIQVFKCLHSVACGLIISTLLGVTIQANVMYSSDACDSTGKHLSTQPTFKCEYTTDRIWTLSLFYGGAFVFLIGSLGTCMNNGYVIIFHMICVGTWASVGFGLIISRISDHNGMYDSFHSITGEVIRDEWKVWATVTWYILGISLTTAIICGVVLSVYFVLYQYI